MGKKRTRHYGVEERRLMLVGSSGVGKSLFKIRMVQNIYVEEYDPTIEDSYRKQLTVDDILCVVIVSDRPASADLTEDILHSEGFLLLFSIASRASFDEVRSLRRRILRVKDVEEDQAHEVPMVLVGSKCDLEETREVATKEGAELADEFGCKFLEASAKSGINVDESFFEIIRAVRRRREPDLESERSSRCMLS